MDYDAIADQILSRARPVKPAPVTVSEYADPTDDPWSTVSRAIRWLREHDESQARALLKMAYDAGLDDAANAASECCGCNVGQGNFDGFIERILNLTKGG